MLVISEILLSLFDLAHAISILLFVLEDLYRVNGSSYRWV